MNIKEREQMLIKQYEEGVITRSEFINLTLEALEDELTYPDEEDDQ